MNTYIALLRGINVGGKNKIPMSELKVTFEKLGFLDVVTYINSGNVIFSSENNDVNELKRKCEDSIKETFGFIIPVVIVTPEYLEDVLKNAPEWWDTKDKEIYDNTIFVIPPTSVEEVISVVGGIKAEYEKVESYHNVIYWSFYTKHFSKTRLSKLASSSVNNKVTIRTANTIRKLLSMAK